MMSIQGERTFTSCVAKTKSLKPNESGTFYESIPETFLTNTPAAPYHVQVCQVKQSSTTAPTIHFDLYQKSGLIEYGKLSTPPHIARTRTLKPSVLNALYENCPNTHLTNMPAASAPGFVQVCPVGNAPTPQLNTVPTVQTYLHKKFNSTVQIGNVEHRVNRTLFNQMISIPTEAPVEFDSSTSPCNDTGERV